MSARSSSSPDNSVAYINGRVYTVDSRAPWAEAFIVSPEGTFSAVGSTQDIQARAQTNRLIVRDLKGQFIMPGLHDAHVHLLFAALANTSQVCLPMQGLNASNVVEELQKGSCACKYMHSYQDWIVANAYEIEKFDRDFLDRAYPETPVVVRAGAGHSAYLNSEAMRRSGYSVDHEKDSQGSCYIRDSEGRLTGEMAEMSLSKVYLKVPQPNLAHVKRMLKYAQSRLHRAGITSCQEASANTAVLRGLGELDAEGSLKLETHTHIVYAPDWIGEEDSQSLHALLDQAATYKSKHVDTRFVKIILDGVPLPPYWSQAGFKDDGEVDESKLSITNVHEAVRKYDAMGMTIKVHCTGQGATRLTLDAFEAARTANPTGPRHEVAHCSGVHDDDYQRYQKLNVTAEMSPAFFFVHPVTAGSGGLMDWNFSKMLVAGAHITIGSDWGAGEAPDLLPFMAGVVESIGGGDRAAGGAKICKMLTLAGAEAVGRDTELGSIEVGKKANFIAVDRDLSQGDFAGANVLSTWFEGEVVYEKQ